MKATMVSFPDFNHNIEDMIAQGDKVMIRLTNRGTREGAFWVEANILGLNMQLGVELKPPEAGIK